MTLPSAGSSISLKQVNVELNLTATATINMGGTAVRGLFDDASGAISMSDGYGKSNALFMAATGGTVVTEGDFKVHIFKSSGTFQIGTVGNAAGSNTVTALIVAGGGGSNGTAYSGGYCGGGGAGGMREITGSSLSAQGYTMTVGAAGNGFSTAGNGGNGAAFGTTNTGGGGGGQYYNLSGSVGANGGSGGGGGGDHPNAGGSGVSGQGNNGGYSYAEQPGEGGGGGGGKSQVGENAPSNRGGNGGNGGTTSIINATNAGNQSVGEVSSGNVYFAGGACGMRISGQTGGLGGGGDIRTAGGTNTGGGGCSAVGGSGVVIVRYKFQ